MHIKILKEIKGALHTLKKDEVYTLPFAVEDKKTKRSMSLEIIHTENTNIFADGFFLSFYSNTNSNADGYAASSYPLRFNKDFVFCESASASTPTLQEGNQLSLL
jgi:hypothetical protein